VPTILLVEDEDLHRMLIRSALEMADYQVREAVNGKEALRQYRLAPTDLVITDIVMPEKDGLELIWELTRDFPEIRIIAMSEPHEAYDYLRVAQLFGANCCLLKPFLTETLLKAVREELECDL
jgi:two-component system response regulator (stage 0 sporulation protein F)